MVRVEFFGIPRRRAGQASIDIEVDGPARLGDVLRRLGERCPEWAGECLHGEQLQPGFVANLDGEQFVVDPEMRIEANACLLIMTADAGG